MLAVFGQPRRHQTTAENACDLPRSPPHVVVACKRKRRRALRVMAAGAVTGNDWRNITAEDRRRRRSRIVCVRCGAIRNCTSENQRAAERDRHVLRLMIVGHGQSIVLAIPSGWAGRMTSIILTGNCKNRHVPAKTGTCGIAFSRDLRGYDHFLPAVIRRRMLREHKLTPAIPARPMATGAGSGTTV